MTGTLQFDIYGRFTLVVYWTGTEWRALRKGHGQSRPERDLVFPIGLEAAEIRTFLDDWYHELATPGSEIRQLES